LSCDLCAPPLYVTPADRVCAFDDGGLFRSQNWCCGTLAALKGISLVAHSTEIPDEPHHYNRMAPIAHDGRFVVLFWRDNTAVVDQAVVIRSGPVFYLEPLRISLAQEVIAAHTRRRS
jgi:hypothetical protein